ncbi:MAG: hypothetical protein M3Q71_10085 [Chloroflexota bacterium]|nr:hypothetical protein [Chloroflexota bacterium]
MDKADGQDCVPEALRLTVLSHELRSALVVIAGRTGLLQRRQLRGEMGGERTGDDLAAIQAAVQRLAELIDQVEAGSKDDRPDS